MSKIISIVLGAISAIVGLILLVKWWDSFVYMFKATLSIVLIIGGAVALIAGLGELKDEIQDKLDKKSS